MATQLFTSTVNTALGYAPQRKVAVLCDGSLAVVQNDGGFPHLYQVTSPSTSPSTTSVQQFTTASSNSTTTPSLFILNSGTTSSDVWIVSGNNDTSGLMYVYHGTYTASGSSWSFDNTGTLVSPGANFTVADIVWTGTHLMVAYRHDSSSTSVFANATTDITGKTGWGTAYQLGSSTGSQTHGYVGFNHDATNGCTIAVYTLSTASAGHDTVVARVIADGTAPTAQANWSAETSLSGNINVGAANLAHALDETHQYLHVAWCDSATTPNPKYMKCTYTTSAVTAGTSFSITGGGGTGATSPALALDGAGTVTLFWASAAGGAASDISYVQISSPYGSGNTGTVTNLTNGSTNDWVFPCTAHQTAVAGYIPLLYLKSNVSPFATFLDTSISAGSGGGNVTQTQTEAQSATASFTLNVVMGPQAETQSATDTVATILGRVLSQSVSDAHSATDAKSTTLATNPGTNIAGIVRSTGTQTWNFSGNGYGAGDVTGTEFDYIYRDSTSSGWAIGAIPSYGGMPVSAWYQIDGATGLNTTLPKKTSATGNLMTLLTTQAGGIVHWEQAVNSTFAASENPTYKNTGNFSELAPVGSDFRAYIKAIADSADANGISWSSTACLYPGDPGLVTFRFDQHNATGATITVDESDVELVASLLGDTGTNPVGIWNMTAGYIGTIGGGTTQWTNANNRNTGTFDYVYITPDTAQSTIVLGTGACVLQDPSAQFAWSTGNTAGWRVADSGPSATKPSRIKQGFYTGTVATWNIPAGQTNTYYVLRVFKRNLTNADMQAIAADWKFPGTPTVTVGSYSSFSYDEKAFTGATSGNQFKVTLDMTPANVTKRIKPIFKLSNWTDSNPPVLTWGGSALTANADYRYYNDTTNQVLYLQLWYDVVTSGAAAGQKNNAQLVVSAPSQGLTQTTSDQHTGTDALTHAVRLARADATSGVEALLRSVLRAQADTTSGVEALLRSVLLPQFDTTSGVEALLRSVLHTQADMTSGVETLLRSVLRTQLDTLSATDVLSLLSGSIVTITDQQSARDSLTRFVTLLALDATSGLEQVLHQMVIHLVEQQSAVDLGIASRVLLLSVMESFGWADSPTGVLAHSEGYRVLAILTSLIASSLGITVTLSSTPQLGITTTVSSTHQLGITFSSEVT